MGQLILLRCFFYLNKEMMLKIVNMHMRTDADEYIYKYKLNCMFMRDYCKQGKRVL